tara:strand:+ start:113 stop:502 length:390 start_codon:yes stop_codon:yes gene_type:complete
MNELSMLSNAMTDMDTMFKTQEHMKKKFLCLITNNTGIQQIKMMYELGYKFPPNICVELAEVGSIESIEYLYTKGYKLTVTTAYVAAKHDQYKCLKYLHRKRCPFDDKCILKIKILSDRCRDYVKTMKN